MHFSSFVVVLFRLFQSGEEQKSLKELTNLFGEIPFSEDHVTIPEGFNPSSLLPGQLIRVYINASSGSPASPAPDKCM